MTDTPLPVFQSHRDCFLCDLHKGVKSVGIPCRFHQESLPPSVNTPAVLYIGQNPGFQEDKDGACFVGPSGKLLSLMYIGGVVNKPGHPAHGQQVGPGIGSRASVYITNTARCATWGDLEPSKKQYNLCAPYLMDDIRAILPTCSRLILMLMGAPAIFHTYTLLTGKGINVKDSTSRAGEVVSLPHPASGQVQVFSTYHPAFVIRKNAMASAVVDHLQLLVDSLDNVAALPTRPLIVPPCSPSQLVGASR